MNAKEALAVAKQVREKDIASVFLVVMAEIQRQARLGRTQCTVNVPRWAVAVVLNELRRRGYSYGTKMVETELPRIDIDWSGA